MRVPAIKGHSSNARAIISGHQFCGTSGLPHHLIGSVRIVHALHGAIGEGLCVYAFAQKLSQLRVAVGVKIKQAACCISIWKAGPTWCPAERLSRPTDYQWGDSADGQVITGAYALALRQIRNGTVEPTRVRAVGPVVTTFQNILPIKVAALTIGS